jgi:FSR family fosmidomycin resistance protein-like MFS transporter
MNSKKLIFKNISVYSLTHALIDCVSAGVVFSLLALEYVSLEYFFYLVVLYNILAFGLQAPIGFLIDKIKKPKGVALLGILFAFLAIIFLNSPLSAVILVGLGNSLFHVGGGIISLNLIPRKATMPGIYVAPGAAGLFIGAVIGKSGNFIAWPFLILLLIFAILIY